MLVTLIKLIKPAFSYLYSSRFLKVCAFLGLGFAALITFKTMAPSAPEKAYVIAITQFVEHIALDEERESIIKTLQARFEPTQKLHFIYRNAQGNVATTVQIAAQIVSQNPKPDLIIAIATPSAQAVASEATKHNIPVIFTAVTDPVQARLVRSLDKQEPGSMITGVSDALPVSEMLEFVRANVANIKDVGVIYNPGESNSASQVQAMRDVAGSLGLTLVLAAVTKTADVGVAAESLVGRVSAILIPNDNTAVAAIEGAVLAANKNAVPIFAADFGSVNRGVDAAIGYSRQALGVEAGNMAIDILNGKPPSQIPVKYSHPIQIKRKAL